MIGIVVARLHFRSICQKCGEPVEFDVTLAPDPESEKRSYNYLCPHCGSPFHFDTHEGDGDFWKLMVYQDTMGETESPEPQPSRVELLRSEG